MVKVSIIVPIYNAALYLECCVKSLLKQSFKDIEILLIDNNSKDNVYEIAQKFASRYALVKVFNCKKQGIAAVRNFAIEKAKGEFILSVDGDDYIDCDVVKKLVDYAESNGLDIVSYGRTMHYYDGHIVKNNGNKKELSPQKLYAFQTTTFCQVLIRRVILIKNNLRINEGLHCYEDMSLIPTLLIYTNKVGHVDEFGYHYMQNKSSLTDTDHGYQKHQEDIFKALANIRKEYKKAGIYDEYREEIEFRHIRSLLRASAYRFLPYKEGRKNFKKIRKVMRENYPHWYKNKYFKQMPKARRRYCLVCYFNGVWLIRFIHYLKNILK